MINNCQLKNTSVCLTCTHQLCPDNKKIKITVESEITKKIIEKYDNGILIERIVEYL